MMNLKMQRFQLALVTGASSGIGEALACLLAHQGIHLLLTGRNRQQLESLQQKLSAQVQVDCLVADLRQVEDRKEVVAAIHARCPDLIVNNAGIGLYGGVLENPISQSLEMLEVNIKALVEITLEGARTLVSKGKTGTILNVSSAAAFQIFPSFAVYSASKTFVNRFTESLDEEFRPYGIRVLAACPGMVGTRFQERAGAKHQETARNKKFMTPEFAAQEIWKQIDRGQTIRIFDWRYRLGTLLSRYLIPKRWLAKILKSSIESRYPKKEIM
jgi:short-subunit dehydrogenase